MKQYTSKNCIGSNYGTIPIVNKIAIQGQAGSYHHQAAVTLLGESIKIVPCTTFRRTFQALEQDKAEFGIIAIENSLFGSINNVYDLLLEYQFPIVAETYLRIEHCLIGLPETELQSINEVHTQAEAMAQCEDFLDTHLPNAQRIDQSDTALSVEYIKKQNDPHKAAIGSEHAATLHGLKIIKRGIEDHAENYTRFVLIQKQTTQQQGPTKTSLVLKTQADKKAGTLHQALGVFAERNLNLTMLQSRPIAGKAWHYLFYVDLEIANDDPKFTSAQQELAQLGYDTIVLGSYTNSYVAPKTNRN